MKLIYLLTTALLASCSGFLDVKPDQKMAIPKTLDHADLLLNDYGTMNMGYPTYGEIAADDYFVRSADWQSIYDVDERNAHIWSSEDIVNSVQWQNSYRVVYRSNEVLALLAELDRRKEEQRYNRIAGHAYFFRAFAFHQLASVFAPAYSTATTAAEWGIPLRLSPALDYQSVRASLAQSYGQIVIDYKRAVQVLPNEEPLLGRPSKAAAYAGLARVFLDMGNYHDAFLYADSCLSLKSALLDYNSISSAIALPFPRFNVEVLFPAVSVISDPLSQGFGRIATALYTSYDESDIRKEAFFRHNSSDPGTYAFKGSYDNTPGGLFVGLTTSELYLIRAEAAVRTGSVSNALRDLNKLLENRFARGDFTPLTESNADKLLTIILEERRKELVFRGRRWSDLKRLNQDSRFAKTLVREVDGKQFQLEPNSPKYAIKIPLVVIEQSGMEQNRR